MCDNSNEPEVKIYMKPELAAFGTELLISSLQKGNTAALFIGEDIPARAAAAIMPEDTEEEEPTEENTPF